MERDVSQQGLKARAVNYGLNAFDRFQTFVLRDGEERRQFAEVEKRRAAMPTFEQILGALPQEMQPEFDELGRYVGEIARKSGGFDSEVESAFLTETQQNAFTRFSELSTIGRGLLVQES